MRWILLVGRQNDLPFAFIKLELQIFDQDVLTLIAGVDVAGVALPLHADVKTNGILDRAGEITVNRTRRGPLAVTGGKAVQITLGFILGVSWDHRASQAFDFSRGGAGAADHPHRCHADVRDVHLAGVVVLDPIKFHALNQAVVDRRVLADIGLGKAGVSTSSLVVAAVDVGRPVVAFDDAGVSALKTGAAKGVAAAGPVVVFIPVFTHRHRLLVAAIGARTLVGVVPTLAAGVGCSTVSAGAAKEVAA